ncbi:MAG: polysaccharide deacetylase family protein [candidate division FCPU426 bacterium]
MNLPILMYHHLLLDQPQDQLGVTLDAFARQVRWLAGSGFHSVSLGRVAAACAGGAPLPKRPVVITFDDAYQASLERAQSVLSGVGFAATAFAVSSAVGKNNFWDDGRVPCADAGQLRRLAGQGWEIGSHSRTHAHLPRLDDPALAGEIQGSRQDLEQMLGAPVLSFSYPFGEWDRRVRDAVAGAGYWTACATSPQTASVTADLLALRRVYVKAGDSLAAFRRKVSGWYLWYRGWRRR